MAVLQSAWGWARALLHSVCDQFDGESRNAQFGAVLDALVDKLPQVAAHLDAARTDILAFAAFPKAVWRRIWSHTPGTAQPRDPPPHQRRWGSFPGRDALVCSSAQSYDERPPGRPARCRLSQTQPALPRR